MRTRIIKTGLIRQGVEEIIELQDDGYRIRASWVQGAPDSHKNEDTAILWAEYKQCDMPYIGDLVADILMGERDSTLLPNQEEISTE